MRTYHYSVRVGRGKATFPTVALGSLRGSLAFFWKGRGVQFPWLATSQTYLSALFSFQRTIGLSACETYQLLIGFHRLASFNIRTGKRESVKSCP
ncbi:transposase [Clostridioides difficile]|nr:transposase [Clostridioides difficile]RHT60420.1 transposase [Ruminococcus sp. AM28-41]EGT3859685.1 transposase [Clostridioides difficile]MDB0257818.1 transposase [Clostridioides difficile]MDB0482119.1 transposase [Clostridioides difficile]